MWFGGGTPDERGGYVAMTRGWRYFLLLQGLGCGLGGIAMFGPSGWRLVSTFALMILAGGMAGWISAKIDHTE